MGAKLLVAGDGRRADSEWPRGLRAAARAYNQARLGYLAGHSGHRDRQPELEPAMDFGRGASPLGYAAPNLTLIDYYSREPHG